MSMKARAGPKRRILFRYNDLCVSVFMDHLEFEIEYPTDSHGYTSTAGESVPKKEILRLQKSLMKAF